MKYFKYTVLFIFLLCTTTFASTQKTAAEKLAGLLDQFTTFQAQFSQTTMDVQEQVLERSAGTVSIMRPGQFRWETDNPTHQIVITDGNTLWVYDVDLKQATKQSIAKSPMNPAKLLSGHTNDLLKQFTVHLIPHRTALVFQLIPKKPNQQFRSIAIAFAHEKLQSMQIENNAEQTTIFDFSHVILNEHLSPSIFQFKAPSGVDVMR
ncbi:MAG: hypothetical protein ACD_42C00491G0003 [uncultured bacterium]|nr:MAG: hypothetical protein ACD_42C00491G0003 [uncultured bacterium]